MTDEELSKCLEVEAERDIARFEIERLRAALTDIRDIDIDIPAEDMLANVRATAALALGGVIEQTASSEGKS